MVDKLDILTDQVGKLSQRRALVGSQIDRETTALDQVNKRIASLRSAQGAFQEIAEEIQNQVHRRIAVVVSRCLQDVFGDQAYIFRVHFEKKRGKTEARFLFEREGSEVDPLLASGGGVVDVTAFALRLAALRLAQPRPRALLVLDEPFKHLSADYRPLIALMLDRLATELDIQILLVTHIPEIATGEIYEL